MLAVSPGLSGVSWLALHVLGDCTLMPSQHAMSAAKHRELTVSRLTSSCSAVLANQPPSAAHEA